MIGDKIRQSRQAQRLSLNSVASRAHISTATLSRIETSKQGLAMDLFLVIAEILNVAPEDLLEHEGADRGDSELLADRIADLPSSERTQLWRDLAANRRSARSSRLVARRDIAYQVDELLAQIEFIREEMNAVQRRLKRK